MSFFFSNSRRNRRASDQHSNRPSSIQSIPTSLPTYRLNQTSPPSYTSGMTAAASIQNPRERVHAWSAGIPSVASTDTTSVVDDQQSLFDTGSVTGTFVDAAASAPYLYYLVYTENGIIPSQQPVDPSKPYLGRIDAFVIAPPHTTNSIKRCICKIENILDHTHTNLFASTSSPTAMNNDDHVEILTGDGPGSTPGQPLALVQVDVFAKRLKVKYALTGVSEVCGPIVTFPIYCSGPQSRGWLDCEEDEILRTDGVIRSEKYEGYEVNVYEARNSVGKIGFVVAGYCDLL